MIDVKKNFSGEEERKRVNKRNHNGECGREGKTRVVGEGREERKAAHSETHGTVEKRGKKKVDKRRKSGYNSKAPLRNGKTVQVKRHLEN